MKHITYAMMLMGALLTATSCSDDAFDAPVVEHAVQGKEVTITVGLPQSEDHSRVAYDDATMELTWQEDDKLLICGYNTTTDPTGKTTTTTTRSSFKLKSGAGTAQATFTGRLDKKADYYKVFYETPNLNLEKDGTPKFSYTQQVQTVAAPTAHFKDYLFLSSDPATGELQLSKEDITTNTCVLTAHNSIFRFDIESYKEVGDVHALIWSSNKNTETPSYVNLTLEGEATQSKSLKAYFAFNPDSMKLAAGQPITLTFIGDEGICLAEATSTEGKEYKPGYRYNAKVSTTPGAGALSTWTAIAPDDTKAEVLVTTTDGKLPDSMPTTDKHTAAIPGTNSFLLSYDNEVQALNGTFYGSENLLSALFSDKMTSIPAECFYNCRALVNVKLPKVVTIKSYTFSWCTALKHIKLPEVTTLSDNAFSNSGIETIDLPAITSFTNFNLADYEHLRTLNIGPNVKELPLSLCIRCSNLTTVTGCEGVTAIGVNAFSGCTALTNFAPFNTGKLTTIDDYAFEDCTSLSTPLPLTATALGTGVIQESGITEFTIHDNLTQLTADSSPLWAASQLTKLIVLTADINQANQFIPTEEEWNPHPNLIDLYLLKDWNAQTDARYRPDFITNKWNNRVWKSITLIDADGQTVPFDESGNTSLPDVGEGGSAL